MDERVSNRQALSLGDLHKTFLRFHVKNQPLINFESWFTKYLIDVSYRYLGNKWLFY